MTTNEPQALILVGKQVEAMMWCLAEIADYPDRIPEDPRSPLACLLAAGWPRASIIASSNRLLEQVLELRIEGPLAPVDRDVLRVCIEAGSWVRGYIELGPAGGDDEDCRRVLRGLAAALEQRFGIECNFIADD